MAFCAILDDLFSALPGNGDGFYQNIDASSLLRFPLSYPGYFLVRLVYGALDIATALGLTWSAGVLIGISAADLSLRPGRCWPLPASWCSILRWPEWFLYGSSTGSQTRRSREVGVLFILMMICFQVAGPVLGRYSRWPAPRKLTVLAKLLPLERSLPPGLAAGLVTKATQGQHSSAIFCAGLLAAYTAGALWVLHLRLHGQYRGEGASVGEKPRTAGFVYGGASVRRGWRLPLLPGPVSAVYEKELRYFSRSGPMLFTQSLPVIMVFVLWGAVRLDGTADKFRFPCGAACACW